MRHEEKIKNDFKDHKAYYSSYIKLEKDGNRIVDDIEVLYWKKPDSAIYGVIYMMKYNSLFITGDLGEAVYCWSSPEKLKWVANLDLQYFASKCKASENGRGNKEWDPDYTENKLKEYMKDNFDENDYKEIWMKFEEERGPSALFYQQEWHSWLQDHGYEVFGDEWYEWAPDIGNVISLRCEYHLLGLKMAVDQLKNIPPED